MVEIHLIPSSNNVQQVKKLLTDLNNNDFSIIQQDDNINDFITVFFPKMIMVKKYLISVTLKNGTKKKNIFGKFVYNETLNNDTLKLFSKRMYGVADEEINIGNIDFENEISKDILMN